MGGAYSISDRADNTKFRCLPVRGEICKSEDWHNRSGYCFFPYRKDTNIKRKTGIVDFNSRMYADTYREAVEMYNNLVQERIDNLYQMIESAKKDIIKVRR